MVADLSVLALHFSQVLYSLAGLRVVIHVPAEVLGKLLLNAWEALLALAQVAVADKDQLAKALISLVDPEKDSVHFVVNDFNAAVLAVSIEVGLFEQNTVPVSFFAEVQWLGI